MVVSIELMLSISTILSMLSTLQSPFSCEQTYSVISQINVPSSALLDSLSYPPKITRQFKEAQQYAYNAKKTAEAIKSNMFLCSYLNTPGLSKEMQVMLSMFLETVTKTKANYYNALSKASSIYSFEIKQAESDYIKMDKVGFDVLENTIQKAEFDRTKNLLLTSYSSTSSLTIYSLESEQQRLMNNLLKGGWRGGVSFFNNFLGKEGSLKLFQKNHDDSLRLLASLEEKYEDEKEDFEKNYNKLDKLIKELENQGVSSITKDFQSKAPSFFTEISFSDSSSPSKQLLDLKSSLTKAPLKKAQRIYSLKMDNYLASAFLSLSKANLKQQQSIKQADFLLSRLTKIRNSLQKKCLEQLSAMPSSSPVYEEVAEKCNSEINLKTDMENYLQVISIAKENYSDYYWIETYVKNSIVQLQKLGYRMDEEKQILSNIEATKAPLSNKISSLFKLKSEIEKKALPSKQLFEKKSIEVNSLMKAVKENKGIFFISSSELEKDEAEEQVIQSQDFYPNAFDFMQKQNTLLEKYKSLISNSSSNYFAANHFEKFFFETMPECGKQVKGTLFVSVFNDLADIEQSSFTINVLGEEKQLKMLFFKKGHEFTANFSFSKQVLYCQKQVNSADGKTIISKIKATPLIPLEKARIHFSLPSNAVVLSSSGAYLNNYVYLENLESEQDVYVIYSLENSQNSSAAPLSSFLSSDEEAFEPSYFNISSFKSFFKEENKTNSTNVFFTENKQMQLQSTLKTQNLSKDYSHLSSLLFEYRKAVDDDVQIPHEERYNDYANYSEKINALTGLNYAEFQKKKQAIEQELDSKISFLKTNAQQLYKVAEEKGNKEFAERAKQWLDKGYYTRSILYSEFAINNKEDMSPLIAVAFIIIILSAYVFLKKESKTVEKKIERKLYSFD